jgi:uncharacterized protein YecE (DUF72 family)
MPGPRNFYSGISGLQTPIPKRDFPPEHADKSRLAFYASLFNSIEVNSSFYKIPIAKTLIKWAAEVPDDFKFTFKLWQGITHNKGLAFNPDDVFKFMEIIGAVGTKKGCLLIQFPPSITIAQQRQLQLLLDKVSEANNDKQWKVAVEFRHKSWYDESIYELLESFNASMVIQDLPASASPLLTTADDFVYLRFHGPNGGYRGSYPDDVLYEYASYIKEWQEDKRVYTYFNNTMGAAMNNLLLLKGFVEEQE